MTSSNISPRSRAVLTRRQQKLLNHLQTHHNEHGVGESYTELAETLGFKSKSTIANIVKQLENLGYIRHTPKKARTLELVQNIQEDPPRTIGYHGVLKEKTPYLALARPLGIINSPAFLPKLRHKNIAFALNIPDAIAAGLKIGDILIFCISNTIEPETLALFAIDKEFLLFGRYRENTSQNTIEIISPNPKNPMQSFPKSRVKLIGKLAGMQRKL